MAKESVKVLFVGGYGRSGSTILDLLLDRVPGITAVGEFRHLFGRALGDNELCSCGKPFQDCDYWQKIIKRAFPNGYDRERIQDAVKTFNTVLMTRQLEHPEIMSSELKAKAKIYKDAFSAAYRAVAEVSNASVVIDSSKYPAHGLFIRNIPSIDMKTMLLVRDPRAVAYSWQRHRIRPEIHWEKREMPRHNVIRSALAWNMSNSLTKKIETNNADFRLQRYEDFIEKPLETIQEIASFALGKPITIDESLFNTQPTIPHTIAGNPVRLGNESVTVRPDLEWQEKMPAINKLAVAAICAPQMYKYNYSLKT